MGMRDVSELTGIMAVSKLSRITGQSGLSDISEVTRIMRPSRITPDALVSGTILERGMPVNVLTFSWPVFQVCYLYPLESS